MKKRLLDKLRKSNHMIFISIHNKFKDGGSENGCVGLDSRLSKIKKPESNDYWTSFNTGRIEFVHGKLFKSWKIIGA